MSFYAVLFDASLLYPCRTGSLRAPPRFRHPLSMPPLPSVQHPQPFSLGQLWLHPLQELTRFRANSKHSRWILNSAHHTYRYPLTSHSQGHIVLLERRSKISLIIIEERRALVEVNNGRVDRCKVCMIQISSRKTPKLLDYSTAT